MKLRAALGALLVLLLCGLGWFASRGGPEPSPAAATAATAAVEANAASEDALVPRERVRPEKQSGTDVPRVPAENGTCGH